MVVVDVLDVLLLLLEETERTATQAIVGEL